MENYFVIVYLRGGEKVRLNNETELSQGLLDQYPKATKAVLYYRNDMGTNELDVFYNS